MHNNTAAMLNEILEQMAADMRSLAGGGDIAMQEFDAKVRNFCAELARLPEAEAKKYEPRLAEMIAHLTDLIPQLETRRDMLEDKINSLTRRSVAYNAYGNAMVLALQSVEGEE